MIDILPLLRHLNDLVDQATDVPHLLRSGFSQAVIDYCLVQGFLREPLSVVTLTKEGLDQVVFDDILGVPC